MDVETHDNNASWYATILLGVLCVAQSICLVHIRKRPVYAHMAVQTQGVDDVRQLEAVHLALLDKLRALRKERNDLQEAYDLQNNELQKHIVRLEKSLGDYEKDHERFLQEMAMFEADSANTEYEWIHVPVPKAVFAKFVEEGKVEKRLTV
jgi:hypothetical protein